MEPTTDDVCVFCGEELDDDTVNGMCQKCQDSFFIDDETQDEG